MKKLCGSVECSEITFSVKSDYFVVKETKSGPYNKTQKNSEEFEIAGTWTVHNIPGNRKNMDFFFLNKTLKKQIGCTNEKNTQGKLNKLLEQK